MANWLDLVSKSHNRSHPAGEYELVVNAGVDTSKLAALEQKLGVKFPSEFRDFYSACNGFGIKSDDEDQVSWLFVPSEEIESFATEIRRWFEETHPKFSNRFWPFIDFMNGDGIGYVLDDAGGVHDGLFCFEHESYRFNPEQDVNEFLRQKPVGIEEFLLCC